MRMQKNSPAFETSHEVGIKQTRKGMECNKNPD